VLQACGDGLLATHQIHRQSHADDVSRAIYLIPSIVLGDLLRCQPDDFSAGYFAGSG
jgi:hypothetical protein